MFDVIVIGAGVVGAAIARELSQYDLKILVLEKSVEPGQGTYLIATKGSISRMVISTPGLFWGIVSAFGVVSYTLLSQNLIKKFGNISLDRKSVV